VDQWKRANSYVEDDGRTHSVAENVTKYVDPISGLRTSRRVYAHRSRKEASSGAVGSPPTKSGDPEVIIDDCVTTTGQPEPNPDSRASTPRKETTPLRRKKAPKMSEIRQALGLSEGGPAIKAPEVLPQIRVLLDETQTAQQSTPPEVSSDKTENYDTQELESKVVVEQASGEEQKLIEREEVTLADITSQDSGADKSDLPAVTGEDEVVVDQLEVEEQPELEAVERFESMIEVVENTSARVESTLEIAEEATEHVIEKQENDVQASSRRKMIDVGVQCEIHNTYSSVEKIVRSRMAENTESKSRVSSTSSKKRSKDSSSKTTISEKVKVAAAAVATPVKKEQKKTEKSEVPRRSSAPESTVYTHVGRMASTQSENFHTGGCCCCYDQLHQQMLGCLAMMTMRLQQQHSFHCQHHHDHVHHLQHRCNPAGWQHFPNFGQVHGLVNPPYSPQPSSHSSSTHKNSCTHQHSTAQAPPVDTHPYHHHDQQRATKISPVLIEQRANEDIGLSNSGTSVATMHQQAANLISLSAAAPESVKQTDINRPVLSGPAPYLLAAGNMAESSFSAQACSDFLQQSSRVQYEPVESSTEHWRHPASFGVPPISQPTIPDVYLAGAHHAWPQFFVQHDQFAPLQVSGNSSVDHYAHHFSTSVPVNEHDADDASQMSPAFGSEHSTAH